MVNPYYHRLTSLFAQQQKYHRPWQMNISRAMEKLRAQLAQDLGVSQQYYQDGRYRYVEWKTPSREDFCLDAPGVLGHQARTPIVHAELAIALEYDDDISLCYCPIQIRYRPSTGAEYRVMVHRGRWVSEMDAMVKAIMSALIAQMTQGS